MAQLIRNHRQCRHRYRNITQYKLSQGVCDETTERIRLSSKRRRKEGDGILSPLLARGGRRAAPHSLRGGRFECVSVMVFEILMAANREKNNIQWRGQGRKGPWLK